MLLSTMLQNKALSPFILPHTISISPLNKKYNKPLLPSSTLVKTLHNQLLIQFKCHIPHHQSQLLEDKLIVLASLSQHQQFIKMKYFSVKQESSNKEKNYFAVLIYFEYLGEMEAEELDKYVRRKKGGGNFIMSEDVLLGYLETLARGVSIVEQMRYLRHGYLNLFTIYKEKEGDKLKLLFNPFYPLSCIQLLCNQPNIQYFKNYFLSPQQLIALHKSKPSMPQFTSQSDVFSMGIIIITLSTLHLSNNYCYLEYSHSDAGIDESNLNDKLSFIEQYYSVEFVRLIKLMIERDQADRIGTSELLEKISDIFKRRKEREKKYHHSLLRVLGEKKYKSINYKLKFQKEKQASKQKKKEKSVGKVEDLKMGGAIDEDVVFRGTFGKDDKGEGYYGLPSHKKQQEQSEKKLPKKIEKKDSTEKKPAFKKGHLDQNKESQSTEKKKHKQGKSAEKKIEESKEFDQDFQYNPIVDLQSKFKQYETQAHESQQEHKQQYKSYLQDDQQKQQQYKQNSQKHHPQSKSKSKQKQKPNQKPASKLEPITQQQTQKQSQSFLKPQQPSSFQYPSKLQTIVTKNPEPQDKLPFEYSSQSFPIHLIQFFGYVVPEKKLFKPSSHQQLSIKFKTQGIMISKNIYYGYCFQGRRQGLGLNIFPQGEYYYGYYDQDLQHGQGIYWWKPTQYFIGEFHYGKKLSGWMINGSKTFFGNYLNNQKTGYGVNFEENSIFQGFWECGKREGEGIIFYKNGDMFRGIWRNGKRNGLGLEKKYSTNIQIQGQWRDDQQIHPVSVKYPNKHTFKGEYKNGKKVGKGQYYFHNGTKFQGIFKDDDCYEGSFYFSNNSIYYGKVNKALKRQGYGTNIDENGDKYEGQWVDDMKHGDGKYETALETMTGLWKYGHLWEGSIVDSLGNYHKVQNGKMNNAL